MKRGKWNWWTLAAVGTVAMALSGSQCSRISDRVTSPTGNDIGASVSETTGGGVSACIQACNQAARDARDAEKELHKNNLDACKELSGSERDACMDEENARHDARMEEISMDLEACKAPCHEQGSGSGGQ